MRHDVVSLRTVGINREGVEHWDGARRVWMTLGEAKADGIALDYVAESIGPRERGMVYLGGYCWEVNTVHDVFVCVESGARDRVTGKFLPRRAVWWAVAEESASDHGRVRRHSTSWTYTNRPYQPLFMIGQ